MLGVKFGPPIPSYFYFLILKLYNNCTLYFLNLYFSTFKAEWKCVATNDFGHSVTSCFLRLIIPKHFKKPRFLENLRAILSEEGAVNLECKVKLILHLILIFYY